ncbi:MAG: peroxidase family protein, partial [Miltoncostaeaceae bacterium]
IVLGGPGAPADRVDVLNGTGPWATDPTGLEDVDFWIGGLAEAPPALGGMLSPTFAFVFRSTLEKLQSGDRFYYLARLEGLSLLPEVEANSFAEIVQRNTDVRTMPFVAFLTPDFVFDLENEGVANLSDDPALLPTVGAQRRFVPNAGQGVAGDEHIVVAGIAGPDSIRGGGGDDTLWGYDGDDRLDGDVGADALIGGPGDDTLLDSGGPLDADLLKGGPGNDYINGGQGPDEILAGDGRDVVVGTEGPKEVFLGSGADLFIGGTGDDAAQGNEGDDWMEGGDGADALIGGHDDPLQNDRVTGDDVLIGGIGDDANSAEGGDDIVINAGGVDEHLGGFGFDWAAHRAPAPGQPLVADLNLT